MIGPEDKEEPKNTFGQNPATAGAERRVVVINNRIDSRDLFTGTRAIVITHGGDAYHLRLTSQNKLILTK